MTSALLATLLFLKGGARDVEFSKKALQTWASGASPCFQLTEEPKQGAYTLQVERRHHGFLISRDAMITRLYNPDHNLIWKGQGWTGNLEQTSRSAHAPAINPELLVALGCSTPQESQIPPAPVIVQEFHPPGSATAQQGKPLGEVVLSVLVGRDGKVRDVRVVRGLPTKLGLTQKAVETVKKWKFSPATRDGFPVEARVLVKIAYRSPVKSAR